MDIKSLSSGSSYKNYSTNILKNISVPEKKQIKKDSKEMLLRSLAGFSVLGMGALLIINKIRKGKTADITNITDTIKADIKDIPTVIIKKIQDIDFNKGIAEFQGERYTGEVSDILHNGDKIQLLYSNGILQSSMRSGKKNIFKTYGISDHGKTIIIHTDGTRKTCFLTRITNIVKEQQAKLNSILANQENLPIAEFKKQIAEIKFKSKKQQELINEIVRKKESYIQITTKKYSPEERKKILSEYKYRNLDSNIKESLMKSSDQHIAILEKLQCDSLYANSHYYGLLHLKDKEQLGKILYLLNSKAAPYSDIEALLKSAQLNDVGFERVCELAKLGLQCQDAINGDFILKFNAIDLPDEQYTKLIHILKNGYNFPLYTYKNIISLSDDKYKLALKLADEYNCHEPEVFANLSSAHLDECIKAFKNGVAPHCSRLAEISTEELSYLNKLADTESNVADIITEYLYGERKYKLPDDLEIIKKAIKTRVQNHKNTIQYDFEDLSDPQKRADFIKLNKDVIDNNLELPENWRSTYMAGRYMRGMTNECKDMFLEKSSLGRFRTRKKEPLGRWMYIIDINSFINNFPKEGEIYAPQRIQSFAKTLHGAEGIKFSDRNRLASNVKFIVHPKEELSMAYDIGRGKYGSSEAIYKSSQKFKVINKGWQIITLNDSPPYRLYVIEMEEV